MEGKQDDIFNETDAISNKITAVSEANAGADGSLENLTFDGTAVSTTITDDSDANEVTLSATGSTSEDGGSITYTATIAAVANNDITVTTDEGNITIDAGDLSGDLVVAVNQDDICLLYTSDAADDTAVCEANAGADGSLKDLTFDGTAVRTTITDDSDANAVPLSAHGSTSEHDG